MQQSLAVLGPAHRHRQVGLEEGEQESQRLQHGKRVAHLTLGVVDHAQEVGGDLDGGPPTEDGFDEMFVNVLAEGMEDGVEGLGGVQGLHKLLHTNDKLLLRRRVDIIKE